MASLTNRLRDVVLRFGPTSALLLISQAISAVSLSLLPLLGLKVSDVYAIGVQTGTGPYNGLVLGVVYLLVIGRPNFSRWSVVNASVSLFSLGLTGFSLYSALYHARPHGLPPSQIIPIIVLFGIGGLALGLASVSGVRQACLGRPWLLAGVTMLPNLAMSVTTCVSFACFRKYTGVAVAPAASWCFAAVLTTVLFATRPLPPVSSLTPKIVEETRRNKILHVTGLVVGLASSTVLPIGFVTAAGKLNAGSATILFLANRIGSAIVGVFVNAVLMVKINWDEPTRLSTRYSYIFPIFSAAFVLASVGLHYGAASPLVTYVIVALSWLCLTCSTPVILREANVRKLGSVLVTKSIVDVCATSLALFLFQKHPSATGYFGASMISQQITCIVCGSAFKDTRLIAGSAFGLALSVLLLLQGW